MQNEIREGILAFILGGNASFTIVQDKGNIQAKYNVRKSKDSNLYFISTSTDNGKMEYQGYITRNDLYHIKAGNKGKANEERNSKNIKALLWVMWHANDLPKSVHVLHHGRCSVCGRKLTDAISLSYGIGPTCRERLGEL